MNRKLHNSLIAFSASGLMLMAGLLAANPATLATDAPTLTRVAATLPTAAHAHLADSVDLAARTAAVQASAVETSLEARIEARSNAFAAGIDRNPNADVGETLASALAFAAEISTEAALVAAFQNGSGDADGTERADEERKRERHARQIRGAMAVPYFSFAQGLRAGAGS